MAEQSIGDIGDNDIVGLVHRVEDANSALIRGDIRRYLALVKHADDYTLMDPFGGAPARGFDPSPEHLAGLAHAFKGGEGHVELVQSYASGDLVVLVIIERQRVAFGNLPEQDWSLRVTLVFRREGSDWLLVHRHADPLTRGISIEQTAYLARG